ncbi:MAG: DUF2283 domain-containing protein [Chloroflexi bacterium]|nr:MAG: DUF2283 domain-containing protein [Chloroflexota bacterium]HDN79181.1 DUF2283 domain-containing protein [Chloroflexota bacterium]
MEAIKVWYDREGDFLEIVFKEAKGYFREVAEDIYERVDEEGNVIGFAIFNFSRHEKESLTVPLKLSRLVTAGNP